MAALRTTRFAIFRRAGQGAFALLGLGAVLFGVSGCGRDVVEDRTVEQSNAAAVDTDRPLMVQLPAPRSEWIDYSANERKLTLYNLPSAGRWMMKHSENATPYPIGPEHILPEGLNPAETMVYYVRPSGQTSRCVTLAQIQAARPVHVSLR
jgi:hypothetical protein